MQSGGRGLVLELGRGEDKKSGLKAATLISVSNPVSQVLW
jgi:hypothetical protein